MEAEQKKACLSPFGPLEPNTMHWAALRTSHGAGGWKSTVKVLADSVSGKDPIPGSRMVVFLLCSLMADGTRKLSEVSLTRNLMLFMRAPPL